MNPSHLFLIIVNIKQGFIFTNLVLHFRWFISFCYVQIMFSDDIFAVDQVLKELIKVRSCNLIKASSNSPNCSINESIVKSILNIRWDFAFFFLVIIIIVEFLGRPKSFNVAFNQLYHMIDNKWT